MFGACGTVSEKASDLPEPGATARSRSRLVAFSLTFARKIPFLLEATDATSCPQSGPRNRRALHTRHARTMTDRHPIKPAHKAINGRFPDH